MNSLGVVLGVSQPGAPSILYSESHQFCLKAFLGEDRGGGQRHKDPTFRCPEDAPWTGTKSPVAQGGAKAGPEDPFQRTQINESSHFP